MKKGMLAVYVNIISRFSESTRLPQWSGLDE
jgi:hypothetical protein